MRYALIAALFLTACAGQPAAPPQTVTITKTVPVYPPDSLYSVSGACEKVATVRKTATVGDVFNDFIDEKALRADCVGDRQALRDWAATNKAGNK